MSDPEAAARQISIALELPNVGLFVKGARVIGRGSSASVDLYLSDGSELNFESMKDIANPTRLSIELAACTGATPRLKVTQAIELIALIRTLSEHHEVATIDDFSIEWGETYLQTADVVEVDLSDQAQRWDHFRRMRAIDTSTRWGFGALVFSDTDGWRWVRTGWFRAYVQSQDHTVGPQEIAKRMQRIGWIRPGKEGQVRASRPNFPETLAFRFYKVPPRWEETS